MPLSRRQFIQAGTAVLGGLAAFATGCVTPRRGARGSRIETVLGPVSTRALGTVLPHEHVLVDFIGADRVSRDRYDRDEAFAVALPHLQRARELGCATLFECTPAYLGRDPELLRALATASGLQLVTNTGYYGAANDRFLPEHAFSESAGQLAERWLHEWRDGIGETGIRPGFIKIGVDGGPLSEVDRKLVLAAARAHLESGLTIAAHTGDGVAALDQLDTLRRNGIDPAAWIWVHAQNEQDETLHARAAEAGAWIEFDGISPAGLDSHLAHVRAMRQRGLLNRVLLSHDAGWYHVGEPGGGQYRSHETLFTQFLPALRRSGFREEELDRMLVRNPAYAFGIRVRDA